MDRESAVRLLDKKVLGEVIVHHHFSYQTEWQRIWMEFLYLFCEFDDHTFLLTEHKTKKLRQQCQVICERLANPDYEQMELEKELRACALLPVQEEPDDVSDKKFIKRQKAALLRAFIWNYLWSCSDWKNMKEHPAFSNLGSCAGKSGLCSGGTAGALCIHRTGSFPGNRWKQ